MDKVSLEDDVEVIYKNFTEYGLAVLNDDEIIQLINHLAIVNHMPQKPTRLTLYNVFRQYVANELGINSSQIKEWIKESVTQHVDKLLGQVNITDRIKQNIEQKVNNNFTSIMREEMRAALNARINSLHITITDKEKP